MRIFVTVGSMLPFDRLVKAMDEWAREHPECEVFAQIGSSDYRPEHMGWSDMVGPDQYQRRFADSDLIVSHVGMGTVITAAELGRPLLLVPRRVELSEVTSDHQRATAVWLRDRPGVTIVEDEHELVGQVLTAATQPPPARMGGAAAPLLAALRTFADEAVAQRGNRRFR